MFLAGASSDVTAPPDPELTLVEGAENVGVLVRLKDSARNSIDLDSVILKDLDNEKSRSRRPLAKRISRPPVP